MAPRGIGVKLRKQSTGHAVTSGKPSETGLRDPLERPSNGLRHRRALTSKREDRNDCLSMFAMLVRAAARVEEAQGKSRFHHRGQRTHHSQATPSQTRGDGGFEDQALGEQGVVGVGAYEEDLENSTMKNPPFIATGPLPQPRFRPVYS